MELTKESLANLKISVCFRAASNLDHLVENIKAANKGPLPTDLYTESLARLEAAGSVRCNADYARGGPKPPIN